MQSPAPQSEQTRHCRDYRPRRQLFPQTGKLAIGSMATFLKDKQPAGSHLEGGVEHLLAQQVLHYVIHHEAHPALAATAAPGPCLAAERAQDIAEREAAAAAAARLPLLLLLPCPLAP